MTSREPLSRTALVVVVTTLTALIVTGVWAYFFRDRPQVIAVVELGSIEYMPRIAEELHSIREMIKSDNSFYQDTLSTTRSLLGSDSLCALIESAESEERVCDFNVLSTISDELRRSVPAWYDIRDELKLANGIPSDLELLSRGSYGDVQGAWPSGYWRVTVQNKGESVARSVRISIPKAMFVRMAKSGSPTTEEPSGEAIDLGDLLPDDEVLLIAWTSSPPHEYQVEEVSLRHESGYGSVHARVLTGRFWRGLERYFSGGFMSYIVLAMLILMVIVLVGGVYSIWQTFSTRSTRASTDGEVGE